MFGLINLLLVGSAAAGAVSAQPREVRGCRSAPADVTSITLNEFDLNYDYHFTTPSHQVSAGHVSFTISNPALYYEAKCSASSSRLQDFFYGEIEYDCEVPNELDFATFTFNLASKEVTVSQGWQCPGDESTGPQWRAAGNATVDVNCATKSYQNDNWKEGETYSDKSTDCGQINQVVSVDVSGMQ